MLYSMAQQAMFFVSQQGLAASPVRQPSNSASLSLLAEHLLDEGLTDIKLFGDLSDGAFAFFIGGNDSLSQIKGISFHTVELTPIVSRIQSKTVIIRGRTQQKVLMYTPRNISELLDAYQKYLLSKVGKVRILGETEERQLKNVFVELSITTQRASKQHTDILGNANSTTRRPPDPIAGTERDVSPKPLWQSRKEIERRVTPDELLRPSTKAIVAGAPGCGKTTLLKYLALQAQEEKQRLVAWLELKAIDKTLFSQAEKAAARASSLRLLELWLRHLKVQLSLSDAEAKLLRRHWQEKFRAGEIIVLLDGFDELQDEAVERSVNVCISEFVSASHDNSILISTRPYAQHALGSEHLQE